jgi:hypothetical protein
MKFPSTVRLGVSVKVQRRIGERGEGYHIAIIIEIDVVHLIAFIIHDRRPNVVQIRVTQ